MSATNPNREPIQIVEIQQPICENVFGVSPCTASGTADTKCYNTRATCQDPENFALGTPLSLFFAKGHVADMQVSGAPYVIPSLQSVSTSPTKINLAGANPDAQGLGNRALCTIQFQDHQHSDRLVDPYVDGRSWNPLDAERGSFWSRWVVRNKYRQNVVINVYEGYAGQTLAEMTKRQYFMTSIKGPDSRGRVTIQGKDILARIEERKAQAPVGSFGELYAAINASQTSFEVAGALVSEYDASGTIRIGDEIMTYTGVATSTNGIEFTGVTRGTDGSTADEHDEESTVQQCLRYTDEVIDDVLFDLLTTYGGIPAEYLDTTNWASEIGSYLSLYRLTGLVTEPVSVFQIVSEIQMQTLCYLWWDERDALVKLKAIRGVDEEPDTITDDVNILAGTFSLTEKPRERVSRIYVHYLMRDFTQNYDDAEAYTARYGVVNLEAESPQLYGEKAVRNVYARFLRTQALAANTATKIITRYVEVPTEATFEMDAKDRDYWVGDTFRISHYLDRDQYGARRIRQWTVISAEELVPGERVRYTVADTTLYGRIFYIMAADAADYPGYDAAPFKNCYIGNADGLLSDGEQSGRIS